MIFAQIIQSIFEIALAGAFAFSLVYFVVTFVSLTNKTIIKPKNSNYFSSEYPYVTIQIPTFNELAAINCAKKCLEFNYPQEKIQIIIGDDSSDQEISKQIKNFAKKNPNIIISHREKNYGYKPGNLNNMLKKSSGEYILIFDSDFLPDKDFLIQIVQPVIKDPSLSGVQSGWKIMNAQKNLSTLMGSGIVNVVHSILMPLMYDSTNHAIFCGSGELVKKNDIIDLGGWTEGSLTEDVDFSLRLIAAGKRIEYLKDLKVNCETPHTPRDLFLQQMRWAYGVVKSFLTHQENLRKSKLTKLSVKFATLIWSAGYIMISLLLFSFVFGSLNMIFSALGFNPSESVSSSYSIGNFIYDTTLNLILTGGMLLSSIIASFINGFGLKSVGKLLFATLTIGFICMFYVGRGIFSAFVGLPMNWYMLKKEGNDFYPNE